MSASCLILLTAVTACVLADNVLDHIPGDTAFLIKVKNLQQCSAKMGDLAEQFGADAERPAFQGSAGMGDAGDWRERGGRQGGRPGGGGDFVGPAFGRRRRWWCWCR